MKKKQLQEDLKQIKKMLKSARELKAYALKTGASDSLSNLEAHLNVTSKVLENLVAKEKKNE